MTKYDTAFFDGIVAGYNHGREAAHAAFGQALAAQLDLGPLSPEEVAQVGLLAQFTAQNARMETDNADVNVAIANEMAARLGAARAERVIARADEVVMMRQDALVAHGGGGPPSFEGFAATGAELVMRTNPGVDFDALASALAEQSGLAWTREHAAMAVALHAVRLVVAQIQTAAPHVSVEERDAAIALMDQQRASYEESLGAPRVAALSLEFVEHYLAATMNIGDAN